MKHAIMMWCLMPIGLALSQPMIPIFDGTGKMIPEKDYEVLGRVSSDPSLGKLAFAIAVNKKIGFYGFDGKEVLPPLFDRHEIVTGLNKETLIQVTTDIDGEISKTGVLDLNGSMIVPQIYTRIEPMDGPFNTFQLIGTSEDRQGVMMGHTKIIIQPYYTYVYPVSFDRKTFFNVVNEKENTALMDSLGRVIIPFGLSHGDIYPDENSPSSGPVYFSLYDKKKYAFASSSKGIILPLQFDFIESVKPAEKIFFYVKKKKKYGLADGDGKLIVPVEYESIEAVEANGKMYAIVKKKGLYGLADETGAWVAPVTYQLIEALIGAGTTYIFSLNDGKGQSFFLTRDHQLIKEANE